MYRKIKTQDALILVNATTRFSMVVLLYKVLIPTRNTLWILYNTLYCFKWSAYKKDTHIMYIFI